MKGTRERTGEPFKRLCKYVLYSTEFSIDVPLNRGGHNFAGNKVKQINVAIIVLEDVRHNKYYTFDARKKIALENTAVNGQESRAQKDNSVYNDSITSTKENVNKTFDQSDPDGMVGHRGQYDAGNRIITLFANADPSTIIHETAHFFLDDMRRFADNAETAGQLDAIYKYVGSLDDQISREQHEYSDIL